MPLSQGKKDILIKGFAQNASPKERRAAESLITPENASEILIEAAKERVAIVNRESSSERQEWQWVPKESESKENEKNTNDADLHSVKQLISYISKTHPKSITAEVQKTLDRTEKVVKKYTETYKLFAESRNIRRNLSITQDPEEKKALTAKLKVAEDKYVKDLEEYNNLLSGSDQKSKTSQTKEVIASTEFAKVKRTLKESLQNTPTQPPKTEIARKGGRDYGETRF